jgi:excisionase family DNA binding protein
VRPSTPPLTSGKRGLADDERKLIMSAVPVSLTPKWYTVAQVAKLLGYGERKVRMLIISGDLRSLKDGRSRRVLPEWVDEYVALRASQAADDGWP